MDISFLLPCFNVESWIEDCIVSISSQAEGKLEYEIICVDDCSFDNTYEILKRMASQNPRVCALKNDTNHGVSYSRNVALNHSSGKYVWFVDPDDVLINGAVTSFFMLAEKNAADIVVGDFVRIDEDEDPSLYINQYFKQEYSALEIGNNLPILPKRLHGSLSSCIWASLYLKDFLVKNNLYFNEKIHYGEDYLFLLKAGLCDRQVVRTNYPCYLYRQQKSSAMNKPKKDKLVRLYLSFVEAYNEYAQLKDSTDDYDNQKKFESLMAKTQKKICTTLVQINNFRFVCSELKKLKQRKIFPIKEKSNKKITVNSLISSNKLCFYTVWFICNAFRK